MDERQKVTNSKNRFQKQILSHSSKDKLNKTFVLLVGDSVVTAVKPDSDRHRAKVGIAQKSELRKSRNCAQVGEWRSDPVTEMGAK